MTKYLPAYSLLLLAPFTSGLVNGSTTSAAEQLPILLITAKGYETDVLYTPQSVEILDAAATAVTQSPGALFRGKPGLAVQSDGAWGQNPVLRGLQKESIVLMVDGVRLNSAQPQGAVASFASLGLLDSIEVVKGPGSVLHGSGALGGAVNMRTPEAVFTESASMSGRFSASSGSVDKSLGGGVILQAANPDHALVLGATQRNVDNYNTPDGRVSNSGFDSRAFLVKYAFNLSDGHRLQLNLQHQEDHDVWYPGSAKTAPNPALGTLTIHSPLQERQLYELSYQGNIGSGTLEASVYRQEVYREIRGYSSGLERNQVWNDVTFSTDGFRTHYRLPLGEQHLLTVGAETWTMTGDPKRFTYNPPLSDIPVPTSPFRNGEISSHGVFVQDEVMFDDWTLMLGIRYDSVTGNADSKGVGPNQTVTGLKNTSDTLSWSIGTIYNLTPLFNPYVNIGSAYRAPDMRERFEDAERGDGYFHIGNPHLDPEQSTSIEIGLKGRSGLAQYQLAAFHTRIDDYIAGRVTGVATPQGQPIKLTENLDRIEIQGVEAGFEISLDQFITGNHWIMNGGFTWLRGTNKQDNEPLYQMPAPELTIGIGQRPNHGFNWHAQVRGTTRQDRTADIFSNNTEQTTPGYTTTDLHLGWVFGEMSGFSNIEASLDVTNLLDRRYREHLANQPANGRLLAPGRNFLLSLRGQF